MPARGIDEVSSVRVSVPVCTPAATSGARTPLVSRSSSPARITSASFRPMPSIAARASVVAARSCFNVGKLRRSLAPWSARSCGCRAR